tara:strand:+ start:723 stop:929 length:207 start_codon:yes stop_codon:yes gene_type:complete
MKIKKKYIGSKVWSRILERMILVEEGQEKLFEALGINYIFETKVPKLIKKRNVKNTKKRNKHSDSDSN